MLHCDHCVGRSAATARVLAFLLEWCDVKVVASPVALTATARPTHPSVPRAIACAFSRRARQRFTRSDGLLNGMYRKHRVRVTEIGQSLARDRGPYEDPLQITVD